MRVFSKSGPRTALAAAAFMIAAGLHLITAPGAVAAPQCDQRDRMAQVLQEKYKETPVALGVTAQGALVEVLTTAGGTTWSIIVTTPEGLSCLVAAGEGWRTKTQVAQGPEA